MFDYDTLRNSVGYIVFGIFSIIAIIYIVKYSIEIDEEIYKQQMMDNFYQNTRNGASISPQMNTLRNSPQVNTSFGPMDSANNSFSSPQQVLCNINTTPTPNGQANVLIPPRKNTLPSPASPSSINSSNINQYGNYMPTNNFRQSVSYNNRQSRQYLLQTNY